MAFYIYACYIYTKDLYNRYIKILSVTFFSCPNIFNQINILPRKKNITNDNLHKTTIPLLHYPVSKYSSNEYVTSIFPKIHQHRSIALINDYSLPNPRYPPPIHLTSSRTSPKNQFRSPRYLISRCCKSRSFPHKPSGALFSSDVTYVSYRPFLGAEKRVIQSRESISRGQVALFSMD